MPLVSQWNQAAVAEVLILGDYPEMPFEFSRPNDLPQPV